MLCSVLSAAVQEPRCKTLGTYAQRWSNLYYLDRLFTFSVRNMHVADLLPYYNHVNPKSSFLCTVPCTSDSGWQCFLFFNGNNYTTRKATVATLCSLIVITLRLWIRAITRWTIYALFSLVLCWGSCCVTTLWFILYRHSDSIPLQTDVCSENNLYLRILWIDVESDDWVDVFTRRCLHSKCLQRSNGSKCIRACSHQPRFHVISLIHIDEYVARDNSLLARVL